MLDDRRDEVSSILLCLDRVVGGNRAAATSSATADRPEDVVLAPLDDALPFIILDVFCLVAAPSGGNCVGSGETGRCML